jgi:hypothetical protein
LREEIGTMVFGNRVLRRIIRPMRDKVTEEWRKLHNEELKFLYSSTNTFRVIKSSRMKWAWNIARMGERRGVYTVVFGKHDENRPLWIPSLR